MARSDNPGCFSLLFGGKRQKDSGILVEEYPSDEDDYPHKKKVVYFPYRTKDALLTKAEHSFYHVARRVLGEDYVVCPQISLAALFNIRDNRGYYAAFNRISRKRVDFVVCDAVSMAILFGIELDDSSHLREDRQERDDFVNKVFQSAKLPLVHINTMAGYNTNQLRELFDQALGIKTPVINHVPNKPEIRPAPLPTPEKPPVGIRPEMKPEIKLTSEVCPTCGSPFKMMVSTAGPNTGKKFNVCSRYPQCKTHILIE